MSVTISIEFNRFPEIAARLPRETGAVVRKTAFDVEAAAKQFVAVDTGTLKNSITTEMESDLSAIVAPHTDYALAQEYGMAGRPYRFRPYMTPAAEVNRGPFVQAMTQLLQRL